MKIKPMRSILLCCLFLFVIGCGIPQIHSQQIGSVLYVGGNGTGNFSQIQAAIFASQPGDTIIVYPGTYEEYLIINTSLQLQGSGINKTILDGKNMGNVILVNADNVSISGFTIRHSENSFPHAAIYVTSKNNRISDTLLVDNYYGMILMYPTGYNIIENNTIMNNHQCGIYFSGATHNILRDNRVHHQPFNGFGLYDFSNNNVIINNTFSHNELNGVNIRDSYNTTVIENTMIANTYGLHVPPSCFQTTFLDNTFIGNQKALDEEFPSDYLALLASTILIFLCFLLFKKRYQL